MNFRNAMVVLVVVTGTACAPKKIPGTDINDNDDTRSILDVIESYRRAVEKKDAQTIVALADESFRDDGGSNTIEDDLDYQTLGTVLPARLARLEDVRLEINVRKIEFDDEKVKARAVYTWNSTFRLPGLTSRPQAEGEIKQMTFRRVDRRKKSSWRITSGI